MDGHGPESSVQQTSKNDSPTVFPTGSSSEIQLPTNLNDHGLGISDFGPETQVKDSETKLSGDICSVTGQDHSSLQQFGIQKCPKCQNDLLDHDASQDSNTNLPLQDQDADIASQLSQILFDVKEVKVVTDKIKESSAFNTSTENSDDEESDLENHENENEKEDLSEHEEDHAIADSNMILSEEEKFVSQKVEFRNFKGQLVSSQTWKSGRFDLDQARQDVLGRGRVGRTIALMTITLNTDWAKRKKVKPSVILRNPDIGIIGIEKELEIRSRPFINALKQAISYYPAIDYGTTELTLDEPFELIAHHAAELLEYRSTFNNQSKEVVHDGLSMTASTLNLPNAQTNSQACSEVAHKHIGILLDYLNFNGQPGPFQEELYRHQQATPVCTFAMLWLLYKPGTTVYHRSEDHAEALIIETVSRDRTIFDASVDEAPYSLTLWQLRYDGHRVRRGNKTVTISAFEGERPIADLKVIPASFADKVDGGKLRGELVKSGKKWYALLRGGKQQHYTGPTRQYPSENLDTRVVIDVRSYYDTKLDSAAGDVQQPTGPPPDPLGPIRIGLVKPPPPRHRALDGWVADYGEDLATCRCDKCQGIRPHPPLNFPWTDYDVLNPLTEESLELPDTYPDRDHRYLLCERSIWGFVLNTRTWAKLDPAYCREPTINTAAIDSLVMPDDRKRLIRAIVQKYVDPEFTPGKPHEQWGADFIKNKGEGQIFLLHGGPGVGKTFCISENIGRPLLALTCADFGTDEVQMERNLLKWFRLAESWGAVMLLDEADVWLERRLVSDLKRNTMVAVFLRCIEYYRGILFLTSNRVGTFDDAFISRIHVVIKYDNLGVQERSKIWEQFFHKLENERKDIFVDSAAKDYVLEDSKMRTTQWNGREIRNAFQTAVSLAEYRFHHEGGKETRRKVVLDKVDFEQVCKMSVDFKSYLSSLYHGDSEADRAMRQGTR